MNIARVVSFVLCYVVLVRQPLRHPGAALVVSVFLCKEHIWRWSGVDCDSRRHRDLRHHDLRIVVLSAGCYFLTDV
jgi:hypothetical protein